ncbi:MAG: helix-turn-helix transcriptional regulator [Clostridia bacterium]|nr:helix-turn-helix transcriptional regulator [Clostridia bacterium]
MQQNSLGQKIYDLRTQHGYSQETLGNLIGVSRQSISKWELDTASPNADNIIELCKLFSISADYLLGAEENLHQIEKNNDEVVATTSPVVGDDKKKRLERIIKIILFSCLGALAVFITVVIGFVVFSSNQGNIETVYAFSWGDDVKYLIFAIGVIVVALIGIKIFTLIRKR